MSTQAQPHDALVLLRTEHAVVRVLAEASDELEAYAGLLPAIGESLRWDLGALWEELPSEVGWMRCVQTWRASHVAADEFEQLSRSTRLQPGEGLPGRVWATCGPAWIADVRADPNFPRAKPPGARGYGRRSASPSEARTACSGRSSSSPRSAASPTTSC